MSDSAGSEVGECRRPAWFPEDPYRTPLAGSLSFALVFAAYSGLVAWALLVASVPDRRGHATVLASLVVAVTAAVVGVVPWYLRAALDSDVAKALAHYALGAGALGGFVLAYRAAMAVVAMAEAPSVVLWSPALVLSALLGVIFGVFSRPLLPADLDTLARPGAYLEHHLTNWWRYVQLTGSAFVAFGIGIAVTQLGQPDSEPTRMSGEFLPLLTLVAAVGVVWLALFAAVKFYAVGAALREVYGHC